MRNYKVVFIFNNEHKSEVVEAHTAYEAERKILTKYRIKQVESIQSLSL